MITTDFKHTCTLWWPRTHILWKSVALGHFVARYVSNQPVMPFSKLGILTAWSIRIWQFKAHNITATTEWCAAAMCLAGYLPGTCQTLPYYYTYIKFHIFSQTCFFQDWHTNELCLSAEVDIPAVSLVTYINKRHTCPVYTVLYTIPKLMQKYKSITWNAPPVQYCTFTHDMHTCIIYQHLANKLKNHSLLIQYSQIFLQVLRFTPISIIPPMLHNHVFICQWCYIMVPTDSMIKWNTKQHRKCLQHGTLLACLCSHGRDDDSRSSSSKVPVVFVWL